MGDHIHPAGPTRALIVANPASGSHSPQLVHEVEELCADYLRHAEVYCTTAPGDATGAVPAASVVPATAGRRVRSLSSQGRVSFTVFAIACPIRTMRLCL